MTNLGPNGRPLCRWCRTEVAGRRRTFCSDPCVHEWRLRSSTSYLRDCVFERDKGICAICRLDTVKLRRSIMRMTFGARMRAIRRLQEQGLINRRRKTWWEADHIVPVASGGDSNLENIRTLCTGCHRAVTKAYRKVLTRERAQRAAGETPTRAAQSDRSSP